MPFVFEGLRGKEGGGHMKRGASASAGYTPVRCRTSTREAEEAGVEGERLRSEGGWR